MGFLRSLLGSKTAGKMACYDIAKPLTKEAVLCTGMSLGKFRDNIPEDVRVSGLAMVKAAMAYSHYFMHCFNRKYFRQYGIQKLTKAQCTLFPIIAFEFNQHISGVSNDVFFDTYNAFEMALVTFLDDDSAALSVFSSGLCNAIFREESDNPMIIATIAKVAEDGVEHIDFQPKLIELSRWY